MLLRAARDLELKEAQKNTLAKLQQDLRGEQPTGPGPEFKEYQSALVASVRGGKIDTTKLAPLKAAMDKSIQARRGKETAVLNGLYAMLEPQQRKTLVAAVRAKQAEREAQDGARKHNAATPSEADGSKRRLEKLTGELGLDASQQKSVESLIARDKHADPPDAGAAREHMKKRTDAVLAAFEGDGFDAAKVDLSTAPDRKMGESMDRRERFLSQLLPLLKPEQREKLAASMDKPPAQRPGRMGDHADDPGFGLMFDDPSEVDRPGAR
jgi:Spy/CpxP family protein refolding chaperone